MQHRTGVQADNFFVLSGKLGSRAAKRRSSVLRKALAIVHETLESRVLFATNQATESLSGPQGTGSNVTPSNVNVTLNLPTVTGTSPADIQGQLSAGGVKVTDSHEGLNGLQVMVIPASELALRGFGGVAPAGLKSDQLVTVVQWSSVTTSGSTSASVSGTSSGFTCNYASGAGVLFFPVVQVDEEDTNGCGCDGNVNAVYEESSTQCLCDQLSEDTTAADEASKAAVVTFGGTWFGKDGETTAPVNYADGIVNQSETDLLSKGFGSPWGITRNWTNNPQAVIQSDALVSDSQLARQGDATTDVFGNNIVENQLARLVSSGISLGVATNGNDIYWFDQSGAGYLPRFYNNGSLTSVSSTELDYTDEAGQVSAFYSFDSSLPVAQRGQLKFFNNAQGVSTSAAYDSNGELQSVTRNYSSGSVTYAESYVYSYTTVPAGTTSLNRVSQIQLQRTSSASNAIDYVQNVKYTYYGSSGSGSYGNPGDLETATTFDGQSSTNPINTDYYRYYTDNTSGGYTGALKFVFTGANYSRLVKSLASGNPEVETDQNVQAFANYQYTYNSDNQIASELVAGAGGTYNGSGSGTAGLGLYIYSYSSPYYATQSFGVNSWATQTIVTQPNGEKEIVYTNTYGQVMMDIQDQSNTGYTQASDSVRITDYQYDDQGQVTQISHPNAFQADSSGNWYDSDNSDPSTGYISQTQGEVDHIRYYDGSSPATLTSPGGALDYEQSFNISQGTNGPQDPQESWSYIGHNSSSGITVYALAADTTFGLAGGNDPRTTTYSYNWFTGTNSISSTSTTLPIVSSAQNGSNAPNTALVAFNRFGMVVWAENAKDEVSFTDYNIATGAVTTLVNNVSFSNSGGSWSSSYDMTYLPSSWPLTTGGLNLASTTTVDDQGRPLVETSPGNNVTQFVYDDADHEVREFDGMLSGSPTGPTKIYREDWTDGFTETMTTSATPNVTANTLETVDSTNIQSLSRSFVNAAGQIIKTDDYVGVTGLTYNANASFGTLGTNFYESTFDYDVDGNLDRTVDSNGTITRTVYDLYDEPASTWIGVGADEGTASTWPNSGTSSMTKVSATAYDVDGNAIEMVQYPGGGASGRATAMYYDYRDRLIAQLVGGVDSSSTLSGGAGADMLGNDTFVTYNTLDNLGEVIQSQTYNAEQQPITFDGSTFDAPSAINAWRFLGSAGITGATSGVGSGNPNPPSGSNQVAFLQGQGAITQTVSFSAAGSYTVSFQAVQRYYYSSGLATIEVLVDGVFAGSFTPSSSSSYSNETSNVFNVSAGTHTITLQGVDPSNINRTALIDNVSISDASGNSNTPPVLQDPQFQSVYVGGGYDYTPPTGVANMKLTSASFVTYDDLGEVSSSTVYSVDPITGRLLGPYGTQTALSTNFYYDADGNLIAKVGPTGAAVKYQYDGVDRNTYTYVTDGGQLNNASNVQLGTMSAYNAASNVNGDVVLSQTQYVYDGDSNVKETIMSDRFGTDATTSTGMLGNASSGVFARVSYMASYFDAADRDIADVNVGTNGSAGVWNRPVNAPSGSATVLVNATSYNAAGWVDTTTDPLGLVNKYKYDLLGRTTETVANYNVSNNTPTDSTNQTTDYTYDGDGHVVTMTANMPSGTVSQVTHYIYGITTTNGSALDSNDVLFKVQYPDPVSGTNTSTGTYNQSEGYTYDALGEQLTYLNRNGTTHNYTYDLLGRLTADSVSGGSGVDMTVARLGYAYNDQGLLLSATSFNIGGGSLNQIVDKYDGFGRLASDAQSHTGNVSTGSPTVSYAYDASNADRLTSITYPDGRVITYNYNGSGGLDTVLNRITSVNDSSVYLQSYSYFGLDTPVTFTNGNGVSLSYMGSLGSTGGDAGDQYTGLDRFGRIINQNWTGQTSGGVSIRPGIDQFQYGYDRDSNVAYRQNVTATGDSTTNNNLAALSQAYTYDGLNRLTNLSTGTINVSGGTASIATSSGFQTWNLDAVGNWKSNSVNTSGGTVTSNRNNSGQNQVNNISTGSVIATLGYDKNGNTTTSETGQVYVYDGWNRLITVTAANGTLLARYGYDAEGRRITQTHGFAAVTTTTDQYYSNRWQVVQENVGSLVTAEHVWSPFYVDAMIQTITNPNVTGTQSNGGVDAGFGTNTSNHTTTTTLGSSPTSAVAAADGADIVVAAMVGTTPELLFYNASGGLDTAYGSGSGIVSLSWTGATRINGIVVQPNGKIDLAVQTSSGTMSVAQLNYDGSADTGFNGSGLKTLSGMPTARGIVLAADGDLLVAEVSSLSFVVAGLSPSTGAVDTSYNTSGSAMVMVGANTSGSSLTYIGMAESPSGDLILAGAYVYSSGGRSVESVALAAVNTAGSPDSSFGTSGVAVESSGAFSLSPGLSPLAVNAQGKILLGRGTDALGEDGPDSVTLQVTEYNSNGSLNTSFAGSGTASVTISGVNTGVILDIQSNGQIVIGAGGTSNFVLARFNTDGTLDSNFGSSGIQTGAAASGGLAMVTASNGETIMVGTPATGSGIVLQEFHTLTTRFVYYLEYDSNFNVTSISDASGNVIERYSYDGYGNVTVLNPDGTVRGDGTAGSTFFGSYFLHQGLEYDPATGLYYNRARYYDPVLGRFTQEDPAGYVDGANTYQMEESNPAGSLDSTGDFSWNDFRRNIGLLALGPEVAAYTYFSPNSKATQVINGVADKIGDTAISQTASAIKNSGNPFGSALDVGKNVCTQFNNQYNGYRANGLAPVPSAFASVVESTPILDLIPNIGDMLTGVSHSGTSLGHNLTPYDYGYQGTGAAMEIAPLLVGVFAEAGAPSNSISGAAESGIPSTLAQEMQGGGSWLETEEQFNLYHKGAQTIGWADGQFMTSACRMNQLINETGGNPVLLGQKMGVPTWGPNTNLIRMDVTDPMLFNPRMPTASLSGANPLFTPGGFTSGGVPEIVTDPLPGQQVWSTPVK